MRAAPQGTTLGSKLVLLTLHFPRLRLLWSRSLHATADLFRALKEGRDEPDPLAAAAIGARSTMSARLPRAGLLLLLGLQPLGW